MRFRLPVLISVVSVCLALAGCSGGEPSEAQMRSAFDGVMRADATVQSFTIKEFKKLACKAASDRPGYMCDFYTDATANLAYLGPQTIRRNMSGRFIAGKNDEMQFIPGQG